MKKSIVLMTAAATLTLTASLALGYGGYTPGAGIVGSKHDMTTLTATYAFDMESQKRVYAYCHTPHHKLDSGSKLTYNPLWSHTINNENYKAYDSATFNSDFSKIGDPLVGPSRLCLSCHDGVIAIDQHYNANGTAKGDKLTNDTWDAIAVGKDQDGNSTVANTHPIGFDITAITNEKYPEIKLGLDGPMKTKGRTLASLGFAQNGKNYFTCSSCHDVHNKENNEVYFLFDKQEGSKICLMCHDK